MPGGVTLLPGGASSTYGKVNSQPRAVTYGNIGNVVKGCVYYDNLCSVVCSAC